MRNIPKSRSGLLAASLVGAAVLCGIGAAPAGAKSPHEVDPLSVQPTLNPNFAPWSCWEAGAGITCQGEMSAEYAEPFGLQCDGQEVYVRGHGEERMTRWHTADGLATKTIVSLAYVDVFSLSPAGDGNIVTVDGHWQRHYDYLVPGDLSSRVMSEIGAIWLTKERGRGLIMQDTGIVTFAPGEDFETISSMHGIHEAWSDDAAFDELLCDELT